MAPVFCLCKFVLPNAKIGIRKFRLDHGNILKYGGQFWKHYEKTWGNVRYQSTQHVSTPMIGPKPKHRNKKKTLVDVIRVKDESISEGLAKVKRVNQHSIDKTLGIDPTSSNSVEAADSSRIKKDERDIYQIQHDVTSENPINLSENPSIIKSLDTQNLEEVIRWPSYLMHTYDASFILPDNVETSNHNFPNNLHVDYNKIISNDTIENICKSDLTTLSDPLSGFAKTDESKPLVDLMPQLPPDKKSKSKKKVISSKAKKQSKSTDVKAKENVKASMSKSKKVKSDYSLLHSEMIDECTLETSVTGDLVDESLKPLKHKKTTTSTQSLKKRLQHEQHNAEMLALRKQCRQLLFNRTLESYLHMCVNTGLLNRALHTLLYYRNAHIVGLNRDREITSIQPYNILFHGLAKQRDIEKMEYLKGLLEQDGFSLNEESYASFLMYLGKEPRSAANSEYIQNILDNMKKNNIDPQNVFSKVKFIQNDYENAITAIRRVQRSFTPRKEETIVEYNCNLVNSLNNSLYTKNVKPPVAGLATKEDMERWTEEQFALESAGEITIASIEKKDDNAEVQFYRKKLAKWENRWRDVMYSQFVKKVDMLKRSSLASTRRDKEINLYPFLVCLPPEDYVNIMMQEIRNFCSGSESYSLSRYILYKGIAERVYQRWLYYYKKDTGMLEKLKDAYREYGNWMLNESHGDGVTYMPRICWQELMDKEHTMIEWPNNTLISIGQFLYSILLRHIMIWKPLNSEKYMYPALYEIDRSHDYKVIEEIKPAPILIEVYRRAARPTLTFSASVAPMVSPPIPWTSPKSGGYLLHNSHIVRLPSNAVTQKERMEECNKEQLFPVMDSLNQLGAVPWQVNKPMLDLLITVFNNKGWDKMDIPPPVSECPLPPKIKSTMTGKEKRQIIKQRMDLNKKKSEMYSLWCDALYKFSFANHFRDRIFWFPHNMDFRGRVYPMPTHINHMSSDVFRSLLYFARGQNLGARGLRWLKLHLINLTGIVKRESVEDRLLYLESIMDDVIDSADNPLTGEQWWTKSDEPWQTLAACKELVAALRSGNPEEYISYLPVHQDGSCNGLQHYAALGRDEIGAASVNLAPSYIPQDVYSAVAELVEQRRQEDCKARKEIAIMLEGFVKRKVIKQTVMTTVYGVTKFGARLQIERQLKDLDFPVTHTWAASQYLVQNTFNSLEQMFKSAKEIQDWFTDCARMVSKVCRKNMEWVTPLGLPVVQHYTVPVSERDPILKMGMIINLDSVMQPNTMKQKNAFPPNFIHSLDSSHMMLTSLYMQEADKTFISVHDCFWTHASNVDIMNRICREQFIALHKEAILEDLAENLIKRFSFSLKDFKHDGSVQDNARMRINNLLEAVPTKGNFDIDKVQQSTYFFS